MKKLITIFLVIAIILLMACSKETGAPQPTSSITTQKITEPSTQEPTEEPTEVPTEESTEEPTYPDDGKEMSMEEMYRSIINGTRRFYVENRNEYMSIDEYRELFAAEWISFLYFDYDDDGIKEVAVDAYDYTILFLKYKDGEVYGYEDSSRAVGQLYSNGVVEGSGSASTSYYRRLSFADGEVIREELCEADYGMTEMSPQKYIVEGKEVTREEYDAYKEKLLEGAESVEWIPFTVENIDKYIQ